MGASRKRSACGHERGAQNPGIEAYISAAVDAKNGIVYVGEVGELFILPYDPEYNGGIATILRPVTCVGRQLRRNQVSDKLAG